MLAEVRLQLWRQHPRVTPALSPQILDRERTIAYISDALSSVCNTFAGIRRVQLFVGCSYPPNRVLACRLARIIDP
jgi:hypothetical protein